MGDWISQPVNHFHGLALPEPAIPAGYAALIERFDLAVPLPSRLAAIAERHHPEPTPYWQLQTPRHRPADTLEGQLVFALKWKGSISVSSQLSSRRWNRTMSPQLCGKHQPGPLRVEFGFYTSG